MFNGLVGDGKFRKIVTDHFRLDLNLIEGLAVVNPNDASNHFRNDDHVPQVGPHRLRLLTRRGLPFLLQHQNRKINEGLDINGHVEHVTSMHML